MIAEPQPTPYDLKFRVLGFPTRVHPLFWVVTALMGSNTLEGPHPLPFMAIWVAVVFVSILVHELGHALAYRRFSSPARMWLFWFGGLAVSDYPPTRPAARALVSLAGPGAGFALAALVYATEVATDWSGSGLFANEAYYQLMWVNVGWGLINLLPVMPLDGGRACQEVCRLLRVRRPEATALKVSVGTGIAMALFSLMNYSGKPPELAALVPPVARVGSIYVTVLFGLLAFSSYQALQQVRGRRTVWDDPDDDTPPWRR